MPSAPRPLSPARLLAVSFGGLIAAGTLLLSLPVAVEPGAHITPVDALFTATSAVCVTGLIVVDTPRVFSTFGEVVLLLLIQLGGLGYMTISTVAAALIGRRPSLQERLTLQESLNIDTLEGIVRFAWTVAATALAFEAVGAMLLTARFVWDYPLGRAAYLGIFHAVSAFNNAGFSLFSDNLMGYRGDLTVNLVVPLLIICGGLGFLVLKEVRGWLSGGDLLRSFGKMSVHSRVVLVLTAALVTSATLLLLVLEGSNPRTLGNLPPGEAIAAAWFQAVTPRTAGFNTVDIGAMTPAALFLLMVLMFIGAAPGSTGGGVKVTTFGVTVAALWATLRGRREPIVFGRRIPAETIGRAFLVSLIGFLLLNVTAGVLLVTEHRDLLPTLFETTSAFGTVGLSMGQAGSPLSLAGHFSVTGRLLLTAMMFVGRVGPLTLAFAVVGRRPEVRVRYPEAKVSIG
jgi:trk system potassium uptake protein TrkH